MKVSCTFGPPGCGKTQHLIDTAEYEVKKASRALFLSFTKAAAAEATKRIKSDRVIPSTLHSFAFKTLGLASAQVVDDGKLQNFAADLGIPIKSKDEDALQIGDEYIDVISYACNRNLTLGQAYDHFGRPGTPKEFAMFADAYHRWKREFGYFDFDDMLMALQEAEPVVPPVLILDEAQDCSPLQWRVFEFLARRSNKIFLAGDDDQAIYEWSGADPHGMVEFAEKTGGEVRVLAQSHRMPASVHTFVHEHILGQFDRRQPKQFNPRVGGLDCGVSRYGSTNDLDPTEIGAHESLFLVRDRFRMLDAKKVLNAHTIPYRIAGGYSPFDNTKAHAIRGMIQVNMGGIITDQQQRALAIVLNDSAILKGDMSNVAGLDWRKSIPLTETQLEFYSSIDMFAPIRVTLSTIHQAKGREADHVFVDLELTPRVVENLYRDRDAELRVMYVACTRAREGLSLCAENPLI